MKKSTRMKIMENNENNEKIANKNYTKENYANEIENSLEGKTAFKCSFNKTKWKVHLTKYKN